MKFAAVERLACVEIMCWPVGKAERKYAGVTHMDVAGFTRAKADEVNALCARHRVGISGLGYYPNPLDPDPAVAKKATDHLKAVIRAAEMLGLKNVNTFVGRDWRQTVDDNWPRFLRTWKPLIAFAEDHGIKVGIENCPMLFTAQEWPGGKNLMTTPAIWRRAFNDIPSDHFGLNYDPSHFVLQRMDPSVAAARIQEQALPPPCEGCPHPPRADQRRRCIRLARWNGTSRAFPATATRTGPRFMAAVMEVGYDGPVCIEVEDDTFGRTLEGRKAAVKVARNVLQPFFA